MQSVIRIVLRSAHCPAAEGSKFNRPHVWRDRGVFYVRIFIGKQVGKTSNMMPKVCLVKRTDEFQLLKLERKD